MSQQFLETQTQLAWMFAALDQFEVGLGRRLVQKCQRLDERWHVVLVANGCRQKFLGRCFMHQFKRLADEVSQASLLHTLGCRIDRCQRVADRNMLSGPQYPVFRVHYLEADRARSDIAEGANHRARRKLGLLLA